MRGCWWPLVGLVAWLGICSTASAGAPCRVATAGTVLQETPKAWKSRAGCTIQGETRLRVTVVVRAGAGSARTASQARVALAAEAVPPRSASGSARRALLRQE